MPTARIAAILRSESEGARMSPNSRLWIPGGESGESANSAPRPKKPVTTTATAVSRPMPGTRPTSAIAMAATAMPGIPPTRIGTPARAATTRPGKRAWERDSAA